MCAYIADLGQDDVKDPAAIEEIKDKAKAAGGVRYSCDAASTRVEQSFRLVQFRARSAEIRFLVS